MKDCNQLCPWNTLYGCQKPESEPCILSNMACEKFEPKPQTNADHIRSMTDEELGAYLLCPRDFDPKWWCSDIHCHVCVTDWLKQPYKEDT